MQAHSGFSHLGRLENMYNAQYFNRLNDNKFISRVLPAGKRTIFSKTGAGLENSLI